MNDLITVSLETVFDAIPVGLGVVDPDHRIVLMNQTFREQLGLPPDAIPSGTPVADAVHASAVRGVYGPGDPDEQVTEILSADRTRPGLLRRRSFAGRHFDLFNTPIHNGAYIVTAVETTDQVATRAEAETALAQTASALTTLRIGLAVFDRQRHLLLANPSFAALLALPRERLTVGVSFDAMLDMMQARTDFAGPDADGFIESLRYAASGVPSTTRRQRADGRAIDVMVDPLPDGGCTIAVSDITPQARAEDEAHRRARLLDLVLLNIPHGICVYGADHRVAMFNDTYTKVMAGAPLRIGDTLAEIIRRRAEAGEYGEGEPDDVFTTQMAFDITRPQMRRRVRPNGTAVDVRTAPLPDGGHISVVTDISALVQAEAELRRRADELSTMLGHIRHGIMLWAPDKSLVASNPVAADLLGLPTGLLTQGHTEAEVIQALSNLGPGAPSGKNAITAREILDLDGVATSGREFTTVSGRILHAQTSPAPGGGWISTFTDITSIRQTESELRRAKELAEAANQAKSRFLATMSHELRTPLNAIIGFSDALARENGNVAGELVAEYSGQINAAGKQLLSLINIILDVARIESGRFEPSAEVVDIAKAVRIAARQADNAAQAGEVSINLKLPEDLPWLRGDERRITQALSQLLSIAVKFTEAGGLVTVEAGLTPDRGLFVSIADTGIGIPEDELERVFEPFTQLDESLSRRYAGAGLGLFTARAVITAHGGQLQLISRPNEGTTARIILPASRILDPPAG